MTIGTEPAPLSYNGDDSTVDFPITFKYFAKSHIVATLRDAADAETLWVLGTDYTLTAAGVEAGGTLTATTAPATGETLVIELDPPNTQDKSLPLGGPFPSANVEDGLDIAAQRDSKLEALFDRCLRVPRTDTQTGSLLDLPIDSSRANKFLAFDPNGKPAFSAGTGADSGLRGDLGNTADSTLGANLVGMKREETGAVAFTIRKFHKDRTINVKTDFGTETTDIQKALDAAKESNITKLYAPAGTTYVVETQLTYTHEDSRSGGLILVGDGQESTIFDNRVASGAMLRFDQDLGGDFAFGGRLADFKIITSTSPASSKGVIIRAAGMFEVDSISVVGLSSDGLVVLNEDNDPDQNIMFVIRRCHVTSCSGWGIRTDYAASNTAAMYAIRHNRVISCAGGIDVVTANAEVAFNGVALTTTNPQIRLAFVTTHNYNGSVHHNFLEKGRAGEIEVQAMIRGDISENSIVSNDASSGSFGIKIGEDATAQVVGTVIEANRFIVDSAIAGTYKCHQIGANASDCIIRRPRYQSISTATKVSLSSGAEDNGNVIEDSTNAALHAPQLFRIRTSHASGTITPDLLTGAWQQFNLTGATSYTIAKPSNGNADGAHMVISIFNTSGGVVTVTFAADYQTSGYTDPSNSALTSAEFRYDSLSAKWRQIGDWSSNVTNIASVETVTATNVITVAESGRTFFLSAVAGFLSTLPAPAAGLHYKFIVSTSPTSNGYTIATDNDDNIIIGGINELEINTGNDGPYSAVGDLITLVANVAVVGDWVEVISDGTSWFLTGQTNADGGVIIGST